MKKSKTKIKLPKVGQKIYVDSKMSISNGSSDVVGGLATISCVEQKGGYVWVTVKEHPNRTHNWEMLQKEQAKLKKEFGKRKAYPDPDIDTPWIEPGDTVDGVEYIGQ